MWISNKLLPLAFNYLSDNPDRLDFNDLKDYSYLDTSNLSKTNLTLFKFSFTSKLEKTLLLKSNLDYLNVYKTISYLNNSVPITVSSLSNLKDNQYISDSLGYLSEDLPDLYILAKSNEDIYATLTYEIDNITSYSDISSFLTLDTNTVNILFKDNNLAKSMPITKELLENQSFKLENQVIVNYAFKLFDHTSQTASKLFYFDTLLTTKSIKRCVHANEDPYYLDLLIDDSKLYHKVATIEEAYDSIKRSCLLNYTYAFLVE